MDRSIDSFDRDVFEFCPAPNSRDRALLKVVERHVLPRLAVRCPSVIRPERFGDGLSDEIPRMTRLALGADDDRTRGMLHRLSEAGAGFAALQIGLLAPAARRLDLLWRRDEVSFLDVTLAAGNLQRMMRFVALDLMPRSRPPLRRKTILVAAAPGEEHSFGAAMAAEFFRRDGWTVDHVLNPTATSLASAVAANWFDVLGISISTRANAPTLRETIRSVRDASVNREMLVIAGGDALAKDPALLADIGADATLAALETAPARAHRLVRALFGARL